MTEETRQFLRDWTIGCGLASAWVTMQAPKDKLLMWIVQEHNHEVIAGKRKACNNMREYAQAMYAQHGLSGFWRGNLRICVFSALPAGSVLAVNDGINRTFPTYDSKSHFWQSFGVNLLSGGLAGATVTTIFYPFNYARRKTYLDMISSKAHHKNIADGITTTVHRPGPAAAFTGWSLPTVTAFVFRAGQLGGFKQLQDNVNPYKNDTGICGVGSAFLAVAIARAAVLPFSYPIDAVRRRMSLDLQKPIGDRRYSGALDCFAKVVRNEGVRSLYRYMLPEMRRSKGNLMVIVAYDRIKTGFENC